MSDSQRIVRQQNNWTHGFIAYVASGILSLRLVNALPTSISSILTAHNPRPWCPRPRPPPILQFPPPLRNRSSCICSTVCNCESELNFILSPNSGFVVAVNIVEHPFFSFRTIVFAPPETVHSSSVCLIFILLYSGFFFLLSLARFDV